MIRCRYQTATYMTLLFVALCCAARDGYTQRSINAQWKQYDANPFVIKMDIPAKDEGIGGIIVADVNDDGLLDYLVTKPGYLAVYAHDGNKLWILRTSIQVTASAESHGLPGWHGPGVQAGDVDGDGRTEVLFLTKDSVVHIVDGATGREEMSAKPAVPKGAERWEHLVIANLRGKGDRDIILQATNARGYRMGRYVAAYAIENLRGRPLWQTDRFGALAHGGLRIADLDGDGRDEICGFTILSPDGKPTAWSYPPVSKEYAGGASFHIDSLFIADVRPDIPGLEVVLLEEGRNYVSLVNFKRGLLWWETNKRQEPQNAAVGDFDPERPGLEIWCRSRYNEHQKPWTFDAYGRIIRQYEMDDVAPPDWTVRGVEVIHTIDWTGERKQLAAAKERHKSGDVCIFDPISGEFLYRFKERADRLYVADVSGDWREELIVVSGNEIHIYHNDAPNPRPNQPRLWMKQWYRRCKMTWNYYSP